MSSPPDRPLVAVLGPTAVGKTALALSLARHLPVEVVSADSRQVYRGMDIGTAKPSRLEQQEIRHWLLDVVEPDEPFSLAQYQRLAYQAIEDVHSRGRLPLLVGGTGLYVRAVLDGLCIPEVAPDASLRGALQRQAEQEGYLALHARLRKLDPAAAERIDARNVRRVIRALEVCYTLGRPISAAQTAVPPPYRQLRVGLTLPRDRLYQRIDRRIDAMLEAGLVAEVQGLLAKGYDCDLPSMSGLGYRQVGQHLRGEVSLAEAVALIRRDTRRFVRQQNTWFRADDPAIEWFDASGDLERTVAARLKAFLDEPLHDQEQGLDPPAHGSVGGETRQGGT